MSAYSRRRHKSTMIRSARGEPGGLRLHAVEQTTQFRGLPPKPALDPAQGVEFRITDQAGPPELRLSARHHRVDVADGVMLRLRTPCAGAPVGRVGDRAPRATRCPAVRRGSIHRRVLLRSSRPRSRGLGWCRGDDQQNQRAESFTDHRRCVGRIGAGALEDHAAAAKLRAQGCWRPTGLVVDDPVDGARPRRQGLQAGAGVR
jgi:hypothetical protein